jgi:hypothetical protein
MNPKPILIVSAMASAIAIAIAACSREATVVAAAPVLNAVACRDLASRVPVPSSVAAPESLVLSDDVAPNGGLLLRGDDVFVLDLAMGHLLRLDRSGRILSRMGRSGRGPGEFHAAMGLNLTGRAQFLGAQGDTLVAYDGNSIHRFTTAGALVDSRPIAPHARPFLESPQWIRVDGGRIYVEATTAMVLDGGRMTRLPHRSFNVWRVEGDSATSMVSLQLPQFPRMGTGGFFGSPAEARPNWDLRDGCLAAIDGSTPQLILVDVATGVRDTLALPLPDRFADPVAALASLPAEAQPAGEPPAPALLARVSEMLLTPDGWVLLRPVNRADLPNETWRFQLSTGRFVRDTVNGFPYGFTDAGRAYRVLTDDEGVTRILPFAAGDQR